MQAGSDCLAHDICSLTAKPCDYYDVNENYCFYGKESVEFWKSKKYPKEKKD